MKLKQHIIYGGIVSLCLVPKLGLLSSVFWASSVLIDVDHYIDFVYRNRFTSFSIRKMFACYDIILDWKDKPGFLTLNVFHTIEVIIGVYFMSVWLNSNAIKTVFWGMVFHMALDIYSMSRKGVLITRAISFLEYVVRRKLMIWNGLSPNEATEEIIIAVNNRFPISKDTSV